MAEWNEEILDKLAELSYIHCSPEEKQSLLSDLKKIVEYAEQLQKVDTKDISPCNHVLEGIIDTMREDIPDTTISREAFLANAPEQIGGLVRVPSVINKSNKTGEEL